MWCARAVLRTNETNERSIRNRARDSRARVPAQPPLAPMETPKSRYWKCSGNMDTSKAVNGLHGLVDSNDVTSWASVNEELFIGFARNDGISQRAAKKKIVALAHATWSKSSNE